MDRVHRVFKRLDVGKLWLSKLPGDEITFADETSGYEFINSKYAESSSISEKKKKREMKDKRKAFRPDEQCGEKKDLTASFGAWELVLRNIKIKTVM